MPNRKNISTFKKADRAKLRQLLDQYISLPQDNPVDEHKNAPMALMIHADGLLSWHQHFLAKLENWLVVSGGLKFVPLPYWDPAQSIPLELDNGNTNVNMPLPPGLRPQALKTIKNYKALNTRILPYHNSVHNAAGGNMPNPDTSPSDPIFWPFHAFLVAVYERWRNL